MQEADSRYFVYKLLDQDLNVFYVGSGTGARPKRTCGKGAAVKQKMQEPYSIEIVEDGLTKEQAMLKEDALIISLREQGVNLLNTNRVSLPHEMDYDFFNEILEYDPTSPTCLRYKVYRYKNKGAVSKRPGDVAGKLDRFRYTLKVFKTTYLAHRIVWLLHHKTIDRWTVIDHINGDATDNRIENLRQVTHRENSRNRARAIPESGKRAVWFKNNKCWAVGWFDREGKAKTTSFSVNKYGNEEAFRLACEFRDKKIEEMKEYGIVFTERHLQ